ncbi:MAG: DUF4054 domain-containing protein [Candidatus Thorarchaeota archaeon]
MIDRQLFEDRFPNFDQQIIDDFFDIAVQELCIFGADRSCGCSDLAQQYALAHLMMIFSGIGKGGNPLKGAITSKSVDGVSVSYAALKDGYGHRDIFWGSTPYGNMFLMATVGCGIGAVFV